MSHVKKQATVVISLPPPLMFLDLFNLSLSTIRIAGPNGLRLRSTAARLLRLWVRIPPGAWMSVCWEWCVLSGRNLCDALITRPQESCRLWCVVVCDLETARMRRPWPALGRSATGGGGYYTYYPEPNEKNSKL